MRAVCQEQSLGILQKPFRSKELIAAVQETLLRRGAFPAPEPEALQQLLS